MIRIVSVAAIIIAVACSFGLYQLKYQTKVAEKEVKKLKSQMAKEEELVHILQAEWNYINRPEHLKALVTKYLPEMREAKPSQLVEMGDIPYRPLSLEDLIGEIESQTLNEQHGKPSETRERGPDSSLTRGGKVNG